MSILSDLYHRLSRIGTPYFDANGETWVEIAPDRFVFVDEDGDVDRQDHSRAEVESGNGALTEFRPANREAPRGRVG